jgi:hypothetical protein
MPKRNGPGVELLADPVRRRIIAAQRSPAVVIGEGDRPQSTGDDTPLVAASRRRPGAKLPSYLDRRAVLYGIDPSSRGPITAWLAGTEIGRPTDRRKP